MKNSTNGGHTKPANTPANQQSVGECCVNCGHSGPLRGGVCYAARDKNDDRIQVHCGCRCTFQSAGERIVDALSRGYLSNAETIAEIDAAILSAVQAERERCAGVAEHHSASDCNGPDCGVVIAVVIRKEKG